MPPPAPVFWKKVDENQVSYFIWPKIVFLSIRTKNSQCSGGSMASIVTNRHQIMSNEFRSAAQKK